EQGIVWYFFAKLLDDLQDSGLYQRLQTAPPGLARLRRDAGLQEIGQDPRSVFRSLAGLLAPDAEQELADDIMIEFLHSSLSIRLLKPVPFREPRRIRGLSSRSTRRNMCFCDF